MHAMSTNCLMKCCSSLDHPLHIILSLVQVLAHPLQEPFKSGLQDWKHVSQRVEEHERSKMHRLCAEAYFLWASKYIKADIASLLHGPQVVAHRDQVRKRRRCWNVL